MEKSVKITLIVTGSVLTLGGIGLATWLLLRKKGEGGIGALRPKTPTSLLGTKQKGESGVEYTFVDAGKQRTTPKEGETIYALRDCELYYRNGVDTDKKNYEEWTKSVKMGDELGVAQKVTSNSLVMNSRLKLPKNQVWIKRGDINAGKICVLRDKNDNPTTLKNVGISNIVSGIMDFANTPEGQELGKQIRAVIKK